MRFLILPAALLALSAPAAAAQPSTFYSTAERLERCANNRTRLEAMKREQVARRYLSDEAIARARSGARSVSAGLVRLQREQDLTAEQDAQARELMRVFGYEWRTDLVPGDGDAAVNENARRNLVALLETVNLHIEYADLSRVERDTFFREMAAHETNLAALRCDEVVFAGSGRYTDGRSTLDVSQAGGVVRARGETLPGQNRSHIDITDCRQQGEEFRCAGRGVYEDADKTINFQGNVILAFGGGNARYSIHLTNVQTSWRVPEFACQVFCVGRGWTFSGRSVP